MPLHARAPAGGDQQPVAAQLAPVVELEDVVVAVAPRGVRVDAEHELDAVAAEHLAERLSERRGLAREHVLGPVDDRHLAAQPAHGLRHLDTDRPAAEDEQPPRDGLHGGHLAVGPDALELAQARDRRHDRIRAVRQHHVVGGVAHAVHLDHARARRAGRCRAGGRCPCSASQRSWPASE